MTRSINRAFISTSLKSEFIICARCDLGLQAKIVQCEPLGKIESCFPAHLRRSCHVDSELSPLLQCPQVMLNRIDFNRAGAAPLSDLRLASFQCRIGDLSALPSSSTPLSTALKWLGLPMAGVTNQFRPNAALTAWAMPGGAILLEQCFAIRWRSHCRHRHKLRCGDDK
jgi:hypothetical protein